MYWLFGLLLIALLTGIQPGFAGKTANADSLLSNAVLDVNSWKYWQRSDGLSARNPFEKGSGGFFPFNMSTLIYSDGLLWGISLPDPANPGQPIRVNGIHYNSGLQPGNIVRAATANDSARAADRQNPAFHIYHARKHILTMKDEQLRREAADYFNIPENEVNTMQIDSIRQIYLDDWQSWPAEWGAPYYDRNRNGRWDADYDEPGMVDADQLLWYVLNDLNGAKSELPFAAPPIGLEVQVTIWGYNKGAGALGQTVFKRYRIINKSGKDLDSLYLGIWSDPDVGDYDDDLVGCDTVRQMMFAYNGKTDDIWYSPFGIKPPAVAYVLLQGPLRPQSGSKALFNFEWIDGFKNAAMESFIYIVPNSLFEPPAGPYEWGLMYYYGLLGYAPIPDSQFKTPFVIGSGPLAGQPTRFPLSGDPVTDPFGQQGDVDGQGSNSYPLDRRMMLNTGPIALAAGETQEIVMAVVGGLGADRLASVKQLQDFALPLHQFYESLSDFVPPQGPVPGGKAPEDTLPTASFFILGQNFPNPFNENTTIRFQVLQDMDLDLSVWNVLGQRVCTLLHEPVPKGDHTLVWNGKNGEGEILPSGLYFVRLQNGARIQWRKMIYLK